MKIVLYIIILGGITGGAIAYFVYNKPHRDIAKAKTDFVLSADQLFSEFDRNEHSSNEKYLDKVIEVSGSVEEITKSGDQANSVILSAEDALMGGVHATFSAGNLKMIDQIKKGDLVKLKCRCTGKLMDVVLVDCSKLAD